MMQKKYWLSTSIILILRLSLVAQPQNEQHWEGVKQYLQKKIVTDSIMLPAHFSICVRNLKNKELININAHKAMVPASNLKLLTTITALDLLGPDYTFNTSVFIDGVVTQDGTLNGNVILKGSGDPTLGSEKFNNFPTGEELTKAIAQQLLKKGIKMINGRFIILAAPSDLNPIPNSWPWGDIGNYYGAPCYSLNFMENMYKITYRPGANLNEQATIDNVSPIMPTIEIINQVKTGKANSGDKSFCYSIPHGNTILLQGNVAASGGKQTLVVKGAHPEPYKALIQYLKTDMAMLGISISSRDTLIYGNVAINSKYELLYKYTSPKLSEIVKQTNLLSVNIFAEGLFKAIGQKLNSPIVYDSIGLAIKKYWQRKGISVAGMNIIDGSGLAPTNTITTSQMTALLSYASNKIWFPYLQASLPVAGSTGTLYKLCKGTVAEGRIAAKTGTLSKISCYSGTINTGNEQVIFSMMINYYEGKPAELAKWVEKVFCKMVE